MNKYTQYELEDFLTDEWFIKWVKKPTWESEIFWEKWLKKNPEKQPLINKARIIIESAHYDEPGYNLKSYNRILENVLNNSYSFRHPVSRRKSGRKSVIFTLTATMALIIVFSFFLIKNGYRKDVLPSYQTVVKSNEKGVKSNFTLPDGTKVYLNSGSRLTFSQPFKRSHVSLAGEAFFEVAEDPANPFTVNSKGIDITALGTSFNVRAFAGEEKVSVVLLEGKVSVDMKNQRSFDSKLINPGEKISLDVTGGEVNISEIDHDNDYVWKDGILVFGQVSFEKFVAEIERWYGVHVIVNSPPKKQWRFKGRFEKQSLEVVLESARYTEGLNYTINKKEVQITFN